MEIEDLKKEVANIVRTELAGTQFFAFFFGSRVSKTNSPTSDLDLGLEGETSVPENIMRSIKSRCDALPTLYSIDIVDFFLLSPEFKRVAKSHIEWITEV